MDYKYQQELEWLYSQLPMFSRVGAAAYKPGLDNTLELDYLYGHPHRRFKSIHIGGTNGKGSTSHLIAAALQANGYKTGLYTSPHLVDFRERMRINGEMIPEKEVVEFIESWRKTDTRLRPSFFELTMMMAFNWFAKEEVDYTVIEVGMGGRLDSTNIITPLLSVITNISFDHTQFLGDTLEKIAGEKAGIIKEGIPCVIGEAEGGVKEVFTQKARDEGSRAVFAEEACPSMRMEQVDKGWKVALDNNREIIIPLGGEYQKKNIRTALCTLHEMERAGIELDATKTAFGLQNVDGLTGLRGRWQKIAEHPVAVCDTGHNVAGLSSSLQTLESRYPGRRKHFVLGFVNDKDVEHIVCLFPKDATYYFTQAQIPRAMAADDVACHFGAAGIIGTSYPTVGEAYVAAREAAGEDDIIYVGGSTFIVADLLAELNISR